MPAETRQTVKATGQVSVIPLLQIKYIYFKLTHQFSSLCYRIMLTIIIVMVNFRILLEINQVEKRDYVASIL